MLLAAFGISASGEEGRIGIRVIDLETFQVVKDIETGIAAEALGWLAPDRLAAYLQSGEVVVVDPRSGDEIAREALGAVSCPFAPQNAVTPLGFVFVIAVAGSARAGSGLRIHHRAGRKLRTLLQGQRVGDVQVAGARTYARTARGLRVVRDGRVVARLPRVRKDAELLPSR
jgi:hypothetical protein